MSRRASSAVRLAVAAAAVLLPAGAASARAQPSTAPASAHQAPLQAMSTRLVAQRPDGNDQTPGQEGEGLLQVTLSAPDTSWGDPVNTSVVVEATIDGGPPQTFVLFAGAEPFTYEGFTGPLTTGPHLLEVSVRTDLSRTPLETPAFVYHSARLTVLTPADPGHADLASAPVLYGRNANNHSDVPLISYAVPGPGGISYTTVWSNEDSGSGVVPAYLWGSYGRMTDIETTVIVQEPVSSARYQGCAACPPDWPEDLTGLDHSYLAFDGDWFHGHPVLRVATGNNLLSDDRRTTPYRFQPALSAPPRPGRTREDAMDQAPWTYRVMGQEVTREHPESSDRPELFVPGDARQYAVVELDAQLSGARSGAVEIRLAGDPTWWPSDYTLVPGQQGSSFPFFTGGLSRTVVKLPPDWHGRALTGVRLRANGAPGGSPTATVRSLRVLEVTEDYRIVERPLPGPVTVVPGLSLVPGG